MELRNQSDRTLDLSDYRLAFGSGAEHRFPAGTSLGPGQLISVSAAATSIPHADGEKLALLNVSGDQVLAAAEIARGASSASRMVADHS